jgi:PAS domain S-box-containing protein
MVDDSIIIQNIKLEHALSTIPSGLYVVDLEMKIVYWNPTAERITGYSAKEAVGQHCSFLQGIPCAEKCGLYQSDTPKPIIGGQCTIVTKSGETIYLLKNMEFLRDADGEIIGGIESFNDITRQRELEMSLRHQAEELEMRVKQRTEELEKSQTRFRTVLDNMDDMAYIASEEYVLTFMNRAMLEMFGDRIGEHCYEVLHNETTSCSWCPMDKVFEHRTLRDERQLGDQGRLYEIVHSPLPPEDGVQQKLAVCRDITVRKQVELDLKETNRELDAFAHSVAHDLRGILAPVVTYMDFLRMTYSEVFEDHILQILGEVERQSERAIALLDDLLDLAQVKQIRLGDQPTDVNLIVDEVVRELELEEDDIPEITSEELPPTWLPETLVYQLFTNLLRNACRYAPITAGEVKVGSWDENHRTTYFVRDHGPGVPRKESEIIFDIFYRGKTSSGQQGTGVGLAIVRKIALRCQGQAWVEQTPGGGATFCIALPKKAPLGSHEEEIA